jgi:heptosyltransferase III
MRRLLIRPGAIGDCLCALPALWLLETEETEVWTNGAVAPLVGFGSRVRSLAGSGWSLLGLPSEPPAELIERLRTFDEILSWAGFGQQELIAQSQRLVLPLQLFPALPDPKGGIHVSDWMIQQTTPWQRRPGWQQLEEEPAAWRKPGGRRFLLTPAPATGQSHGQASTRARVILHPFSGSARKNWPLPLFQQLALDLNADADVVWCASPEDPLPSHLRANALQHESLPELTSDLQTANLYVGNDSGITHLAAMLGVPVLALFGPMDPAVWAPRGSRVHIVRTPTAGDPTATIPYQPVLEAATDALGALAANT